MREECTIQASIFDVFSQHELGRELKAISDWLDDHPKVLGWVGVDLRRHGKTGTAGKQGQYIFFETVDSIYISLAIGVAFRRPERIPGHDF